MKKTLLASALLLATGAANAAVGGFDMYDPGGGVVDANDGLAGTTATTSDTRNFGTGVWDLSSTDTFFFGNWTAHSGTLYDTAGTYEFTAGNNCGYPNSSGCVYQVELLDGYTMGHILFNWGATADIDVLNIWDANGNSVDIDGDGIAGWGMIDGAFIGFNANFTVSPGSPLPIQSYAGAASVVPVPAAAWLFGSGLLGLVGVARRKAVK